MPDDELRTLSRGQGPGHSTPTSNLKSQSLALDDIQSEIVKKDPSLQTGDIISTTKGLFLFTGRADEARGPTDFVAVPEIPSTARPALPNGR
jgi:hypothetical protein